MSSNGPPVDLARGDRLGGFKVCSILGWGAEGVSADVVDEFLDLKRVLKAYPAIPFWIERLRYVTRVFIELSKFDVCPKPIIGGVTATSRGVPTAYLVVERRIGKPLEEVLQRRWSEPRALALIGTLTERLAKVHSVGWAMGDFEAGNNIVMVGDQPMFVDIGLDREAFVRPSFEEDFECLADIARRLAQQSGSDRLIEAAGSLAERCSKRLDSRSLTVWRSRMGLVAEAA